MSKTIIENTTVVTVNDSNDVIEDGYLLINGTRIEDVGEMADLSGRHPGLRSGQCEVIDGAGKVATPGYVNTHTHAAMVLMRGVFDDQPLMPWLQQAIWPIEKKMFDCGLAQDAVYWGTLLAIVEMVRGGTTCFNDMYHSFDAAARAIVESGIRGVPSGVLLGIWPDAPKRLEKAIEFCREWNGAADGRLTVRLAPHAVYTCEPPLLEQIRDAAQELNVGVHIHLSETQWEIQEIEARYGKSPVQLLNDIGFLEVPTLAAHCVHLTDRDIEIMREKKVAVAHNPTSNLKLASGFAPVPRYLREGITVGIGTDGAASNNDLNMIEEARIAALIHKASRLDATTVSASQALRMATIDGARALGLERDIGSLEPGKKADIVLFDFTSPHLTPRHNVVSHLIYSAQASDADTVIIDGTVVMRNRVLTSMDEQAIKSKATRIAKELVGS